MINPDSLRARMQEALRSLPELRTERLRLRKLRADDAEGIFAYASDPEVATYVLWEAHRSLADTRAFLDMVLQQYQSLAPPTWGVELLEKGELIGTCSFVALAPEHARGEIGYALGRKHWGKGYMVEAVRAVLAYGFGPLGLNRIEARCDPHNTGSWRVMEKAGMKFEGLLRQNIVLHGVARDARLYAILREDSPALSTR